MDSSCKGIVNSFVYRASPLEKSLIVRFLALLTGLIKITSLSLKPTFTCNSGRRYGTGFNLRISAPIVIGSFPNILSSTTSVSVEFIEITRYSVSFAVSKTSPSARDLLFCIPDNMSV